MSYKQEGIQLMKWSWQFKYDPPAIASLEKKFLQAIGGEKALKLKVKY